MVVEKKLPKGIQDSWRKAGQTQHTGRPIATQRQRKNVRSGWQEEYHHKYIILGDTPPVAAGIFKQNFKVK
jgi:hypothetical protein